MLLNVAMLMYLILLD